MNIIFLAQNQRLAWKLSAIEYFERVSKTGPGTNGNKELGSEVQVARIWVAV